jgi:glycosyltransferase involved in cell wall biosynthesis
LSSVTAIIPTFNRYEALCDAVDSILMQTHPVAQIVVVDDGSSDERYREFSRPLTTVVHRETNSCVEFGHPAPGVVRNDGMRLAEGEYLAFCDDDDVWLPWKIERQLEAFQRSGCHMSSTEGYYCPSRWDSDRLSAELASGFDSRYPLYNREHFYPQLKKVCQLTHGFPTIWGHGFLSRHNSIITSSVMFLRALVEAAGYFEPAIIGREDWSYWLRLLRHTNSIYVDTPCFGYCSRRPKRSKRRN